MSKALIKKVCTLAGLPASARYLSRRRPLILMYHGLTDSNRISDWTQLAIGDFARQMRYLKDRYHPVPLSELVDMLESGRVEPHAIAVTFDDGYKSNYDLAYPVLKKMSVPATIFVTSGFVSPAADAPSFLWPDFITALLLSVAGRGLDLTAVGLGQQDLSSPRTTYIARDNICEQLKSMNATDKDAIIAALHKEYDHRIEGEHFKEYRPLDPDDIGRLARDGLITIGAHSRNHNILSRLDTAAMQAEIRESKSDLEAITGGKVDQFAYPNGRRRDINVEVVKTTAQYFDCAVTTEAGCNLPGQHRYLLRRLGIGRNLTFRRFQVLLSGIYYLMQKPARRYEDLENR